MNFLNYIVIFYNCFFFNFQKYFYYFLLIIIIVRKLHHFIYVIFKGTMFFYQSFMYVHIIKTYFCTVNRFIV